MVSGGWGTQTKWGWQAETGVSPGHGIESQAMPVGPDRYQAVIVRAQDRNMPFLQPPHYIRVGMAEGVLVARRDNCDRRVDRFQERRHGGGFRTVVAHFKNVGMEVDSRAQEDAFHGALQVAGQKEGSGAIGDAKG